VRSSVAVSGLHTLTTPSPPAVAIESPVGLQAMLGTSLSIVVDANISRVSMSQILSAAGDSPETVADRDRRVDDRFRSSRRTCTWVASRGT
jgi:hypothetical protein